MSWQEKREMKNINELGLFDDQFLMEKLTKPGDPLQKNWINLLTGKYLNHL